MIEAGYVRLMARYNSWQNNQIADIAKVTHEDVFSKDRGAFFGSIHGTLNHILWGDSLWMSRFDSSVAAPSCSFEKNTEMTATMSVWSAERFHLDGKIQHWANALRNVDLKGQVSWYSVTAETQMQKQMDICVSHMFNHQTHHRGQVHAMLTAAGLSAPVTDLVFLVEE